MFLWSLGSCVKLMKRFIRENLIWRVCECGSIRNLCEQRFSFMIFLIATFHVFSIASASPQNRSHIGEHVKWVVKMFNLIFVIESAKENSWHISLFFWINWLFLSYLVLCHLFYPQFYFRDDALISPMEGYFHITLWILNRFPEFAYLNFISIQET